MEKDEDTSNPGGYAGANPVDADLEKGVTSPTPESNADGVAVTKTVTAQDWTGPDDRENPMNWPFGKKAYHTLIPAVSGFTV